MKNFKQLMRNKWFLIGTVIFIIFLIYADSAPMMDSKKMVSQTTCDSAMNQGWFSSGVDVKECLKKGCTIVSDDIRLLQYTSSGGPVYGINWMECVQKWIEDVLASGVNKQCINTVGAQQYFLGSDTNLKLCTSQSNSNEVYKAETTSSKYCDTPIYLCSVIDSSDPDFEEEASKICSSAEQPIADMLYSVWPDSPFEDNCKGAYYAVLAVGFMMFMLMVSVI